MDWYCSSQVQCFIGVYTKRNPLENFSPDNLVLRLLTRYCLRWTDVNIILEIITKQLGELSIDRTLCNGRSGVTNALAHIQISNILHGFGPF